MRLRTKGRDAARGLGKFDDALGDDSVGEIVCVTAGRTRKARRPC